MGCFLGCFGTSKDSSRRRKQRYKVIPRDQKHVTQNLLQAAVSSEQCIKALPSSGLVPELRGTAEEQLSLSTRKKVTFDSNVRTYEHVQVYDSTDSLLEKKGKEETSPELMQSDSQSKSRSSSEDGSAAFSAGIYPPNHRYQNCHESDDEIEDLDDNDGDDFEDEEEDYGDSDSDIDDRILCEEVWTESIQIPTTQVVVESRGEASLGSVSSNKNARDRSGYVHQVLNPVENLTQWKAVKSKGTTPLLKKENFSLNLQSSEPKNRGQEMTVDASLSNWLISSKIATPNKKVASYSDLETITSERSLSQGSTTTFKSIEDRPILGALTVDELKQFPASSTPRKSPSRSSPDEMPIIGSVGSYWSQSGSAKDSSSATSSFKGIPNTTSKYREDKKVNWHSTPFETRLERALNRGAAEA